MYALTQSYNHILTANSTRIQNMHRAFVMSLKCILLYTSDFCLLYIIDTVFVGVYNLECAHVILWTILERKREKASII